MKDWVTWRTTVCEGATSFDKEMRIKFKEDANAGKMDLAPQMLFAVADYADPTLSAIRGAAEQNQQLI